MIIQIILSIFILFALSRVLLQLKSAKLTVQSFIFWSGVFVLALLGVIDPRWTTYLAKALGIGRGADVVLYISIALIFYLIFRLSISLEEIRRDISDLVRKIALETDSPSKKQSKREK